MKKMKSMIFMAILIFTLIGGTTHGADGKYGGELVFGVDTEFKGFDLLRSGIPAICGMIPYHAIHERLFAMNKDGAPIPILGLSATPSNGDKTWTIKLRKGVRFHDGTEFNADAVAKHFQRLLNPENKFRGSAAFKPVASLKKVDHFTVRFQLRHAWLPFLDILSSSRSPIALIPSPKAATSGSQNRAPVGSGPYMFKEWKAGESLTLVKNPNYWQKGKPYLDKIVLKPMPDHQTRFASLLSGQLDIIWTDRGDHIHKAMKEKSMIVRRGEGNGAESYILNTEKPPLDDIRVRRALAHAWNQKVYVKISYKDTIPIVNHPLGPEFSCGNIGYRNYDLKKARELIKAYGKPVEIEVLNSNSKRGREAGEIMQQLFKKIGVTVKPLGLSFAPIVGKVYKGDYQISTWRMPSIPDYGTSFTYNYYSKSRANVTRYKNPEMDKLLIAQRMSTDPEKRKKMHCRIANMLNEDIPVIYRGGRAYHVISKKSVKGIPAPENGYVDLTGARIEK